MATTTTTTTTITEEQLQPIIKPPRRVCFSFAAYSKNLIDHLHRSNVPIADPLTDQEITSIESTYHFTFPPDLRSILQEGLPVGPGFPNWRSSSSQQLHILTSLPILGLCKQVSRRDFWFGPWGDRPNDDDDAVALAKSFLKNVPVLVPVYRNCYISSSPCLAGNPVFYVDGGDVRLWSYDVNAFFQQTEFKGNEVAPVLLKQQPSLSSLFSAPAWAATEARRIEFWTELVGIKEKEKEARGNACAWWNCWGSGTGGTMEEVCWRLREGGWKEEEVREMTMMVDGCDEKRSSWDSRAKGLKDRKALIWHVRLLSLRLLRAGWTTRDVVDSLGLLLEEQQQEDEIQMERSEESCWFDFHNAGAKCEKGHKPSLRQLFNSTSTCIP